MAQSDRHDQAHRGHTTESSTIISIGELMQMEQHRLDEEKQRRDRQRLDHEAALKTARAKRERELLEQKQAAEAARQAREKEEMEQAVALAGKMLGFISRAKVQAEREAEALARQQEHQRTIELAKAKVDARSGVLRTALVIVSAAAMLALGGLVGGYAGVIAPEQNRQVTTLRAELAAKTEHAETLARQLERERGEVRSANEQRAEVSGKLASASQRIDDLERQLRENGGRRTVHNGGASKPPVTVETPADPCPEGDPMCGLRR